MGHLSRWLDHHGLEPDELTGPVWSSSSPTVVLPVVSTGDSPCEERARYRTTCVPWISSLCPSR